jgi:hypothetical protein
MFWISLYTINAVLFYLATKQDFINEDRRVDVTWFWISAGMFFIPVIGTGLLFAFWCSTLNTRWDKRSVNPTQVIAEWLFKPRLNFEITTETKDAD